MSANAPLLSGTIEADEDVQTTHQFPTGNIGESAAPKTRNAADPVVLVPGTAPRDAEEGGINSWNTAVTAIPAFRNVQPPQPISTNNPLGTTADVQAAILKQSSHPGALFCLYFFRSAAIAVYVLCGLFTDNYVLSITIVVVLLSLDFWNTRNVAGRTLVGLRYWNEVDEDGESSWVFECRDPSQVPNPIDTKMFWIALYAYPLGWVALFIVSIFKFNVSFLPIVLLALVFNMSNVVGFTYADRDAQRRFANGASSMLSGLPGLGGIGGQVMGGLVRNSVGRMFR
ncbi:Golgi apparatus membrane protein tvp23 [Apiotrichum porosum]|uniref:Golgi apparatus membrane protein TVP23 n=1 Tax=Apiotrichum porosum TaxID=105984 RepID=A0A427XFD2_9TREE|nr:Golgi apparatus membrane protein tvp23 [Apiotrichum porosum]RSH77610.1 Golgi apparatus membrane protein tvp23 [Apiotrichum porosum]